MKPQARSFSNDPRTRGVRRRLLKWYDRHRRQLPWRQTGDPYRIWISEVMLQQTRVQAVVPYYQRFLRTFPSVKALARAREQELLACWSGLGYYARARNLKKAAGIIVKEHGGRFPRHPQAARRLPGIGDYTAAAVLSIAYGIPLPVLDGNVARVLSRLYALDGDYRSAAGRKPLLQQAARLLSTKRPGDFNQALMELGATVCLPRQPHCGRCPMRHDCQANLQGQVDQYPPSRPQTKPLARRFTAALVRNSVGRILLLRRPPDAQKMAGFWDIPMWEDGVGQAAAGSTKEIVTNGIRLGRRLGSFRHSITTSRLEVAVFQGRLHRRHLPQGAKWIAPRQAGRLAVTTIAHKALRLLESELASSASVENKKRASHAAGPGKL